MKEIEIALAGNPNTGKTSIFNALTGSHQHVGNWPGVTVEKKEGFFEYGDYRVNVVDLPGIYSLTASTIDEKVASDYLMNNSPDVVVCIIDASNIERNFYLLIQLLEMKQNIVIALNMMDIVRNRGIKINEKLLSSLLHGIPVIKTIGHKKIGIDELKEAIINAAGRKSIDISFKYEPIIESAISNIEDTLKKAGINERTRYLAIKLLEDDRNIFEIIRERVPNITTIVKKEQDHIERETEDDSLTLIIDGRYSFIKGILGECIKREIPHSTKRELSDKIDRVIINRFLGIPIFLAIMWFTFQLVFALGSPLGELIGEGFDLLGDAIAGILGKTSPTLVSFLKDGIIAGIGSVIVFLPNILLLFFVISILEDSGYMARAAFVMDKLMHALGLHGKSFIPMILGFGCNVPAIMATRTLESRKDRILTILVNPLMSCSARLPIYILFTSAFFPKHQGLVVFSLYLLGIISAIVVARIFKSIFFKEEVAPLIMELPPYRMPQIKNTIIHMWIKAKAFLYKAGTIIFITVVVVWILASLPPGTKYASKETIIGRIGEFIAPILSPAGFGFWQATLALLFGIMAKEVVVGTFGTLFGLQDRNMLINILPQYFSPASALSFMVMSLIYIPCIATIAAIKRETNWKWAALTVGYSLILGWGLSVLTYQIARLFF